MAKPPDKSPHARSGYWQRMAAECRDPLIRSALLADGNTLTAELIETFLALIAHGSSQFVAAMTCGIDPDKLEQWKAEYPELCSLISDVEKTRNERLRAIVSKRPRKGRRRYAKR